MLLSNKTQILQQTFSSPTLTLAFDELNNFLKTRFNTDNDNEAIDAEFAIHPDRPGYKITVSGNTLKFMGATKLDILYAVYAFAEEQLGFCFLEPGNDRPPTDAPSTLELADGELLCSRPPLLKRRGFIQEFPFSDDSYLIADWMAKNQLNYLMTWMKYYDKMTPELRGFHRIRGIEIESGHHNFDYWIPFNKYYRSNPEFFAIVDGKRIEAKEDESDLLLSKQLCATNPELRKEIVKNIIAYCHTHPEIKTVSLIPNDGFGWCECENCSAFYDKNDMGDLYSVSRHVYRAGRIYHDLFDAVSTGVRQTLPNIKMTFAAYVNYCRPTEGFQLKDNAAVHFAPYWRCINHRIDQPECRTNSEYAADLDRWLATKINGGEVNIYEYYMGVNLYVSLPMVYFEDIFDEMTWYGQKGVDGVLTQFHLPHWSVYGMNYYMMAKAAGGADKQTAVNNMFDKLFGKQTKQAREFFAKMKELTRSAGKCHIPYPYSLFSRTRLEQYTAILECAKQLQANAPGNSLLNDYVVWAEYLCRFKALFDRYHAAGVTCQEIDKFREWVRRHSAKRLFVMSKIDMFLDAWCVAVKTGRDWLHFNIDWEDEYIKTHTSHIDGI